MSHADKIAKFPKSFEIIASTPNCYIAAFRDKIHKTYGVQFHPEVVYTQ